MSGAFWRKSEQYRHWGHVLTNNPAEKAKACILDLLGKKRKLRTGTASTGFATHFNNGSGLSRVIH